jgi:signal transduction histidine kinase
VVQQQIKKFDQTTLQSLIDAFTAYALVTDRAHNTIAVSQATASARGTEVERLLGDMCFSVADGNGCSAEDCPLLETITTGCASRKELYVAETDSWLMASAYSIPVGAAADDVVYLHLFKDITDEKRVAQELSQTLEQQDALNLMLVSIQAAQTPARVLEVAIDHVLQISWLGIRTSAAGFLLRGQQLHLIVSRNLPSVLEQECAQLPLGQCLCGRVAETGDSIICAHVDERHHTSYSGMVDHGHVVLPLKWQFQILGVLNFYLAAGQELDERRTKFLEAVASIVATALGRLTYQSQLAQSERLSSIGLLAAGVAHEINNPLGLVLTTVEWLAEDLPPILEQCRTLRRQLVEELGAARANMLLSNVDKLGDDALFQDLTQCAKDALEGVQRIRTIVHDLKTFSRPDDEELNTVSLSEVLERAVRLSYNEIKYRARVTRDLQPTPPVRAHEGRLAQVFLNLLINAAHAIEEGNPEGNEILVRVWHHGDEVFAEVKDTGKGIDPADLTYVFEPFFTTKDSGVGTGLGLYISNNIVTSLRGRLDVESTVGRGTRFVVRLPVAEPQAPRPTASPGDKHVIQYRP